MGVAEREPGLRTTGDEVDPLAFRDHRQAVARHAHVGDPAPPAAVVALDRRDRVGAAGHLAATGAHPAGRRRAGADPAPGVMQRAFVVPLVAPDDEGLD